MTDYLHDRFSLRGKVAFITGGGSGIGGAIALAMARAGAAVVVCGRRAELLAKTIDEVEKSGGRGAALAADISQTEQLDTIAECAAGFFGAPDILVNAAGVNLRSCADLAISAADITPDKWRQTMAVNLTAPFFLARALAGGMTKGGAIINIGSLQSLRAGLGDAAYGASKGGIAQLTRVMARTWGKDGITVNALIPGFFPSEMTAIVFADDALTESLANSTILGRNGELEDISGAAVFLASPAAAYITGILLPVDGGFLAK
ncbi:MAG: SDR family NAD(P)-dependent oxidoreductase [Gammaproteobacteria bacterium]